MIVLPVIAEGFERINKGVKGGISGVTASQRGGIYVSEVHKTVGVALAKGRTGVGQALDRFPGI